MNSISYSDFMAIDDFSLTGSRLCLRAPRLADAAALHAIAGDERVARSTASIPHPYPEGAAKSRIDLVRRISGPDRRNLAIRLLSNDAFIGMIGFAGTDQVADLTYMISPDHQGSGYATEASVLLISYIFAATFFSTITATAMVSNPASEAVLKKAGFRRERVVEINIPLRGIVTPVSFWRLQAPVARQI